MTASIALVGAGPRAVAVAARLVADRDVIAPGLPLTVHLIDAVDIGAGRTWRRDQNRMLLNNTYCSETTVFADETIVTAGPTRPGPSLAEWLAIAAQGEGDFAPWVVAEARAAQPWSYPSRALQGVYFRWALDRVIDSAPPDIEFVEQLGRVVALDELDGTDAARQRLAFADGRALEVDAVVLLQGFLTSDAPEARELADRARAAGLVYLPPGMPSERDWDVLPAGEPALVRGIGANFFDLIGVLFEGRGGRFERGADGELEYRPSGREPRLVAGSRHGLPYRGKAYYPTGLPEPVELPRFSAAREAELIAAHRGKADVDFGAQLAADVMADFREVYETVAARRSGQGPGAAEPFDWQRIVFPAADLDFADDAAWQSYLDGYFADELARIRHPERSPHKAVHRAMETARRRISRLVLAQVFDPASVVRDLKLGILPHSLVLASGPPPERVERLIALRRAGLVEILGPGLEIEVEDGEFRATTHVPGQSRTARALAEARMLLGDLRTTDDPLVRQLVGTGQARYHEVVGADGTVHATSTLDVTGDRFLLVDAQGRPHARRVVLGSPAGDVQFNAAIGAIPHTGDKMLTGADIAAVQALRAVSPS